MSLIDTMQTALGSRYSIEREPGGGGMGTSGTVERCNRSG